MDVNAYTTAIDHCEKELEKLHKAQFTTLEPPYFLDDSRVLSVSAEHVHQTHAEFDENLAILRQHLEYLEAALADRKREKETIHGMLAGLKAERAKLEQGNGVKRPAADGVEPDAKKPATVSAAVMPPKK